MATKIQDNLVATNLQARNEAKQDRNATSGNRVAMPMPPAVLSHDWRLVSPDSHPVPVRLRRLPAFTRETIGTGRTGRTSVSSHSGCFAVPSGNRSTPYHSLQHDGRHDYQSYVGREATLSGSTGPQKPGRITAPALSRGK